VANIQVVCINKTPRDDTHSGITHLEGVDTANHAWRGRWTRDQMVADIDNRIHDIFTWCEGKWASVGTVHPFGGRPYVKTVSDPKPCNNLLRLPQCPAR